MLQFPPPGELPAPSHFEQFILCLLVVALSTAVLSFLLPRPISYKLFKVAFPLMPDRLEDKNDD
jgi:hypothetical protein